MKQKITSFSAFITAFLMNPLSVLADTRDIGNIAPTDPNVKGIDPNTALGTLLKNALMIIYIIAALAVLFMLVFGAFQWITSGGDKEAVQKARGRITAALVGLALLALALFITVLIGQILDINILGIKELPKLGQ